MVAHVDSVRRAALRGLSPRHQKALVRLARRGVDYCRADMGHRLVEAGYAKLLPPPTRYVPTRYAITESGLWAAALARIKKFSR